MSSGSDEQQAGAFELEQVELYGKYMLTAPLEILFVLRTMQKRGCMATVYFDQGQQFFLSWLLAVDADSHKLIMDVGGDETVNRAARQATKLIVTASLDNVKIQFVLASVSPTTFDKRPAFVADIPKSVLRLQRREYFRLDVPRSDQMRCHIPTAAEGAPRTLDFSLLDISGGGMSLMVPPDLGEYFNIGTIYADCRIDIPHESVIPVTLCVRNAFMIQPRNGGKDYLRVGCEFVNLPGTRLAVIQRYITRIERERKARLADL